jgi:hypothetical protein
MGFFNRFDGIHWTSGIQGVVIDCTREEGRHYNNWSTGKNMKPIDCKRYPNLQKSDGYIIILIKYLNDLFSF